MIKVDIDILLIVFKLTRKTFLPVCRKLIIHVYIRGKNALTLTTLIFFCINPGDQRFFSI